jgi:hypothetical protein
MGPWGQLPESWALSIYRGSKPSSHRVTGPCMLRPTSYHFNTICCTVTTIASWLAVLELELCFAGSGLFLRSKLMHDRTTPRLIYRISTWPDGNVPSSQLIEHHWIASAARLQVVCRGYGKAYIYWFINSQAFANSIVWILLAIATMTILYRGTFISHYLHFQYMHFTLSAFFHIYTYNSNICIFRPLLYVLLLPAFPYL